MHRLCLRLWEDGNQPLSGFLGWTGNLLRAFCLASLIGWVLFEDGAVSSAGWPDALLTGWLLASGVLFGVLLPVALLAILGRWVRLARAA